MKTFKVFRRPLHTSSSASTPHPGWRCRGRRRPRGQKFEIWLGMLLRSEGSRRFLWILAGRALVALSIPSGLMRFLCGFRKGLLELRRFCFTASISVVRRLAERTTQIYLRERTKTCGAKEMDLRLEGFGFLGSPKLILKKSRDPSKPVPFKTDPRLLHNDHAPALQQA